MVEKVKQTLDSVIGQILDERVTNVQIHNTLEPLVPNIKNIFKNMEERGIQYDRTWLAVKAANYFIATHRYDLGASSFVDLYDMLMRVGFSTENGFEGGYSRDLIAALNDAAGIVIDKKETESILNLRRRIYIYWNSGRYGIKNFGIKGNKGILRQRVMWAKDKSTQYFSSVSLGKVEGVVDAYIHLAEHSVNTAKLKQPAFQNYIEQEIFPLMEKLETIIKGYRGSTIRGAKKSLNPIRKQLQLIKKDNPLYKIVNNRLKEALW